MSGSSRSSKRRRGGTAFPGRLALDGLGSPSHISHLSPSSHNRRANSIASSFAVTTPSSCASRSCSRRRIKFSAGNAQRNEIGAGHERRRVEFGGRKGEALAAIVDVRRIDLADGGQSIMQREQLDDSFAGQQPLQFGPWHLSGLGKHAPMSQQPAGPVGVLAQVASVGRRRRRWL